jgi:hypothetical protein
MTRLHSTVLILKFIPARIVIAETSAVRFHANWAVVLQKKNLVMFLLQAHNTLLKHLFEHVMVSLVAGTRR